MIAYVLSKQYTLDKVGINFDNVTVPVESARFFEDEVFTS